MNQTTETSDAARTLKTLEFFVKRAKDRLITASEVLASALAGGDLPPSMDGTDPDAFLARAKVEAKAAEDSFVKLSGTLLSFDKSVDVGRREATEQIPKSDAIKLGKMFAIYMRGSSEQVVSRFCQEAMEVRTPEEMYVRFSEIFISCYGASLASAVAESHIPEWFANAIIDAL